MASDEDRREAYALLQRMGYDEEDFEEGEALAHFRAQARAQARAEERSRVKRPESLLPGLRLALQILEAQRVNVAASGVYVIPMAQREIEAAIRSESRKRRKR